MNHQNIQSQIEDILNGKAILTNEPGTPALVHILEYLPQKYDREGKLFIDIMMGYFWLCTEVLRFFKALYEFAKKHGDKNVKVRIIFHNETSWATKDFFDWLAEGAPEEDASSGTWLRRLPIPHDDSEARKEYITALRELVNKGMIEFGVPKLIHEPAFKVHAKVFIINGELALVGSCNLSKTGLTEEYECMVKAPDNLCPQLKDYFERVWENDKLVKDFKAIPRHLIPRLPTTATTHPLQPVTAAAPPFDLLATIVWLLDLHRIAPNRDLTILQELDKNRCIYLTERHSGVFLASSTGAGKTHVVAEVLRIAFDQGLSAHYPLSPHQQTQPSPKRRKKWLVLVVAPVSVAGGNASNSSWYQVLKQRLGHLQQVKIDHIGNLPGNTIQDRTANFARQGLAKGANSEVWVIPMSYFQEEESTQHTGLPASIDNLRKGCQKRLRSLEGMILIVDEAHNFRNKNSLRFRNLRNFCKELSEFCYQNGLDFKGILSTATPLNLSLEDILNQMELGYHLVRLYNARHLQQSAPRICQLSAHLNSAYQQMLKGQTAQKQNVQQLLDEFRQEAIVRTDWFHIFDYPSSLKALLPQNRLKSFDNNINVLQTRAKQKGYSSLFDDLVHQRQVPYRIPRKHPLSEIWQLVEKILPNLSYYPYAFFPHGQEYQPETVVDQVQICDQTFEISQKHGTALPPVGVHAHHNKGVWFDPDRISNLAIVYKIILAKRLESSLYAFCKSLEKLILRYWAMEVALNACSNLQDQCALHKIADVLSHQSEELEAYAIDEESDQEIDPRQTIKSRIAKITQHLLKDGIDRLVHKIADQIDEETVSKVEDLRREVDEGTTSEWSLTRLLALVLPARRKKTSRSSLSDLDAAIQDLPEEAYLTFSNAAFVFCAIRQSKLTALQQLFQDVKNTVKNELNQLIEVYTKVLYVLRDIYACKAIDPKIERLVSGVLQQYTSRQPANNQPPKILLFSSFKDTVCYLNWYLQKKQNSIPFVWTAETYWANKDNRTAQQIEQQFTSGKFDFLLTTDALSEGVNMGEAKVFINYDIEFNPVRVVQRAGRTLRLKWYADRIASTTDYSALSKDLFFIVPDDPFVQQTIANILNRAKNRLLALLTLVGVEVTLGIVNPTQYQPTPVTAISPQALGSDPLVADILLAILDEYHNQSKGKTSQQIDQQIVQGLVRIGLLNQTQPNNQFALNPVLTYKQLNCLLPALTHNTQLTSSAFKVQYALGNNHNSLQVEANIAYNSADRTQGTQTVASYTLIPSISSTNVNSIQNTELWQKLTHLLNSSGYQLTPPNPNSWLPTVQTLRKTQRAQQTSHHVELKLK